MKRLVPLREAPNLRLSLPAEDRWIDSIGWVPISATEIHLASRYFPLAVRLAERRASLGAMVDQQYLAYPLRSREGHWRGAYRPVALRCFPFEAARSIDDPLSDIMIDANSPYVSEVGGRPIVEPRGLAELQRLFDLLKRAEDSFVATLDHFLIADLLVPLAQPDSASTAGDTSLYLINTARFNQLKGAALGAMAKHRFQSVDVATACVFSLRSLRVDLRPKAVEQPTGGVPAAAAPAPDQVVMDDLPLALDDGELVALPGLADADRPAA